MAPDWCRWYYKGGEHLLSLTCLASGADPAFTLDAKVEGEPIELLICGEIAAGPAEYESSPRLSIDSAADACRSVRTHSLCSVRNNRGLPFMR